ncbi:hypothetical protein BH20ACT22_BH20ACT22_23300 [soil metagenome]
MADEILAIAVAVALVCIVGLCTAGYMAALMFRRSRLVRNVRLSRQRFLSQSRSRRELAGIRARILQATDGTRTIMRMIGERDSTGELRRLHERLEQLAATVGQQLELLSLEPDDRVLEGALTQMRQRTDRVIRAASDVRAAASLLAEEAVDLELAILGEEVRREVQALTYGREVLGRRSATLS